MAQRNTMANTSKMTWLDSTDDLMTLLSARTELQPGEGEAAPLVYLNDKLLGELKSS